MVSEVVEEVRDLSRLYNLLIGMGILDTDLDTVIHIASLAIICGEALTYCN
jgi:Na+/citrate or Na+/malate symporter